MSSLVSLSHCVMDEVWIKVAKRDEPSMGIKVLEHKERGFNLSILTSDLLSTYRAISGYFSGCLHQLCTNHARRITTRIIRDLPLRAKKDRFFYGYMVRIKKRFNALYSLDDIGKINSSIGQIKRELKLFYTQERRKWASPCLDFIKRNSKGLFLYKKLPEKEIEHTNNAAEIIFSLFKPQYKVMKEFQTPEGVQVHLNLFTLRHNFRVFPRGKRKGFSPVQLEGLNVSLNDWSDFIYLGDKAIPEETLFLCGRLKNAIFSKSPS